MMQRLRNIWRDDEAATAVEYAVMIALIIVFAIASVRALGGATAGSFQDTVNRISPHMGS